MKEEISFYQIQSNDQGLIDRIANWYLDEWKIPREVTRQRLTNIPNEDVIFQLVLTKNKAPIATGGLYRKVGLLKAYPKFRKFKPWVALLYTTQENRNSGFGEKLLHKIEEMAKELRFKTIYLHTFTAENFYLRNNWQPIDRVAYKKHMTVVMKKDL